MMATIVGDTSALYNPWSLLECVDNKGKLLPYWSNTSDNELVKRLIAQADQSAKTELEDLLLDNPVVKEIKDTISLPGIENDSVALWSLLLFAGYLTFDSYKIVKGKVICNLALPNQEIILLFQDLIKKIVSQTLTENKIESLKKALITGQHERVEELLQEFVINSMSVFDIAHNEPEKSYHLFVLGLLVLLSDSYQVKSNKESGYGRYDILLIPHNPKDIGIIIEFKKVSSLKKEKIKDSAQKAFDQIVSKKYAQELHQHGIKDCIAYGIAFQGKAVIYCIAQALVLMKI